MGRHNIAWDIQEISTVAANKILMNSVDQLQEVAALFPNTRNHNLFSK